MAGVFSWTRFFAGRTVERVFECRHCGTTVESTTQVCPVCGAEEIACYELG